MELVADIGKTLTTIPTDAFHLNVGERLCHQHVVVYGHDVAAHLLDWTRKCVGGNDDLVAGNGAVGGLDIELGPDSRDANDRAVVVDHDPSCFCVGPQCPDHSTGIDNGRTFRISKPPDIRWRVDFGSHLGCTEKLRRQAETVHRFFEPDDLIVMPVLRSNMDHSGFLKPNFELVVCHELHDFPEVLIAKPEKGFHLARPMRQPIAQPVGQRRLQETSVARTRSETRDLGLENCDCPSRVTFGCHDRCPQTGEASADNHQVGSVSTADRRRGLGRIGRVRPKHRGSRLRERTVDRNRHS